MRRRITATLLAIVFAYCSASSICGAIGIKRIWGNGIACSIDAKAGEELSLLTALYPDIQWTAYAQSAPLIIANYELPARTAKAAALSFLGAPNRIAFFPLASGRLPLIGELGACALTTNTAFELFKSANAQGNLVRIAGNTMRVVGIIDMDYPILLISAKPETILNRLAADDRDTLILLSSALGVAPDPFELSGAETRNLILLLCAAPWLLVAAQFLVPLRGRGGWRKLVFAVLVWALALGVVLAILGCVPVRLVPARWSDMTFYTELAAAFEARPFRQKDIRDELFKRDALRAGLWSAAACIALWMERMWLKRVRSR